MVTNIKYLIDMPGNLFGGVRHGAGIEKGKKASRQYTGYQKSTQGIAISTTL
jgi:hypothetical protein